MSLAILISLPTSVLAAKLTDIRLFYEPSSAKRIDSSLKKAIQRHAKPDALRALNSNNSASEAARKAKTNEQQLARGVGVSEAIEYQYNGYISGTSGRHYLVNGQRLADIDSLVLVSVKSGGQSLILKAKNTPAFELKIGQKIEMGSP